LHCQALLLKHIVVIAFGQHKKIGLGVVRFLDGFTHTKFLFVFLDVCFSLFRKQKHKKIIVPEVIGVSF